MISSEPSSASGFLGFGAALEDRVKYLIIKNETVNGAGSAWDNNPKAKEFTEIFNPAIIQMLYRDRGLQDYLRLHNLTLGAVASGATPEPVEGMYRLMAESLEERVTTQFDKVRDLVLGRC